MRSIEIVSNPADGVWLFARYLSSPGDPALIGQEDMIFAADVVEQLAVLFERFVAMAVQQVRRRTQDGQRCA